MKETTGQLPTNNGNNNSIFIGDNLLHSNVPFRLTEKHPDLPTIQFLSIPFSPPGKPLPGKAMVKNSFTSFIHQDKNLPIPATVEPENKTNLFRLFVKNGEYVYARPDDIIMIESCDHLVKVHLAINGQVKKAVRNNTLKDFLLQLPKDQFTRIGRFCAVNIARLSGGNCKEQTFEFDFKILVKLKRALSQSYFANIGK